MRLTDWDRTKKQATDTDKDKGDVNLCKDELPQRLCILYLYLDICKIVTSTVYISFLFLFFFFADW